MGKHTSCSKAMHDPGAMRGGRRYTQHRGLARDAREGGVGTRACGAERGHAGGVSDGEVASERYMHGSRAPTRAAQQDC